MADRDLPPDFKVVCAWCGALLKGRPEAPRTSHGICARCMDNVLNRAAVRANIVELIPNEAWRADPLVHDDPYVDLGGEG